jgi:hypothetical protein
MVVVRSGRGGRVRVGVGGGGGGVERVRWKARICDAGHGGRGLGERCGRWEGKPVVYVAT